MKAVFFVLTLFLTVTIAGGISSICACGSEIARTRVTGSGVLKSEKRELKNFTGIDAGGAVEVTIASQQDFGVEVEADDNVIALVRTTVEEGILHIEMDDHFSFDNATVKVRISLPELRLLDVSGASVAEVTQIKSENLTVDVSGASRVTLEGAATKLTSEVSGASSFNSEKLNSQHVQIEASGASKGYVHATEHLHAEASGASTIYYHGEPKHLEQETSGVSSIERR